MKKAFLCIISCILPCGALDVIRIVHSNGRVEELTGPVRAAEVLRAHPKHVLKKPTTSTSTIVAVPPDAKLHRGHIYFLIPAAPSSASKKGRNSTSFSPTDKRKRREQTKEQQRNRSTSKTCTSTSNTYNNKKLLSGCNKSTSVRANMVFSSDQYLSEILREKISMVNQKEKKRARVGVWRPHLESICEDAY